MEYKGYKATVAYDDDLGLFHGEVVNIRDVVTFQGKSVQELRKALRDSVDDYLDFCKERGESPDKPFSGRFIVRLSPDQHCRVFTAAKLTGKSLNTWVAETLDFAAKKCA